tara:strand:- start:29 stop:373 length:345 start_codon:yes stop_codon:yes gene_type:complete
MSKVKIILIFFLIFVGYKGFIAIKNFQIGVDKKVTHLEEIAEIEREGQVIALIMYLGNPPKLKEHLYVESGEKCSELKGIAEDNSNAYYECSVVDAILTGNKIISIVKEIEVLE